MAKTQSSRPAILFEDNSLVAFDKPGRVLTGPERRDPARCDPAGLICRQFAPGAHTVHRLDAETSGVLLCAKTEAALAALQRQFDAGRAKAHYLALVAGALPETDLVIRRELEKDSDRPGRMRPAPAYRRGACRTRLHALEVFRAHSLVEAWPGSDRPHQVRVHLAHAGCPVVGDAFYGNGRGLYLSEIKSAYKFKPDEPERPLIGRLALHAARLVFTHPATAVEITIAAPWPKDLAIAVKYLKKFAPSGTMDQDAAGARRC